MTTQLVEDAFAGIETAYMLGWTDGLPVVPATRAAVDAFLARVILPPDHVVAAMTTRNRVCTVEKAAINAVMAGCRPEYFPVVLTALHAMNEEPFNFYGSSASTGGAAQCVVVNGPIRRAIAMNGSGNLYGPGNRANATIGRALRLITMNVFGMQPGVTDRSTQGHPGKFTFCIAENEEASPWEPWHVESGMPPDMSAVTVYAGNAPQNIECHVGQTGEAILTCIADTMANLGSFSNGQSVVVITPEHADIIARDGWTKPAIRGYLYEHARRTLADLKRGGKMSGTLEPGDETTYRHRGEGSDDILLIVGGGDAGGHSSFISSWSRGRASIMQTKPIICAVNGTKE
ncbi:MAG: hypothetical protein AB7R89_26070 [Dehalococcoidia bacterium]